MTGSQCVEALFLINLKFLGGEKKLNVPIYSIIEE